MTVVAAAERAPGRRASTVGHRSFDAARSFDEHGSALLGFAVNALRDHALAEDCVQEIFLRAWRSRDTFDPDRGGERTWLFAIARRVLIDVLRARARTVPVAGAEEIEDVAAIAADPLDRLELAEALAVLSEEHRSIVVAVHLEGLSYQTASERMGVPVGTLRTRAFYALRALRAHLDGLEGAR